MKALMPTNRAVATFQAACDLNVCCNSAIEEKSDLICLASKLLGSVLTDQLLARHAYFLQNSILWKPSNSSASCKIWSLQVGTSTNEAASARKHYTPCQRAPLCIYYTLKQAALCKLYFRAWRYRIESHTLTVPLVWRRKPNTVLLCLTPALPSVGGPDSKSDGYSQLVPTAGQGAAVPRLLAPGWGHLLLPPDKCYLASLSISNETEHYVYSDVHYSCTCILDLSASQKHSNLCRHLDISGHLIL